MLLEVLVEERVAFAMVDEMVLLALALEVVLAEEMVVVAARVLLLLELAVGFTTGGLVNINDTLLPCIEAVVSPSREVGAVAVVGCIVDVWSADVEVRSEGGDVDVNPLPLGRVGS